MESATRVLVAFSIIFTFGGILSGQDGGGQAPGQPGLALSAAGLGLHPPSGGDILNANAMYAAPSSPLGVLPSLSLGEPGDDDDSSNYVLVKAGPLWFVDDLEDLDVGVNTELVFGRQILPFLAIELGTGYFWAEGDSGLFEVDIWGVPITANARLSLPLLFFELHGGAGIGGYYVDTDVDVLGDDDDFVFGGNLFVGLGLELGPLTVGVEGKYIVTTELDLFGTENASLEAFAAMVTAGFRF